MPIPKDFNPIDMPFSRQNRDIDMVPCTAPEDTPSTATAPPFDLIMRYEDGSLSGEEAVALFQNLLDSGLCWSLQGHYGRMAMQMIEEGLIS